jgi:16S rRNA (guanine527-N7)-methyltransferase
VTRPGADSQEQLRIEDLANRYQLSDIASDQLLRLLELLVCDPLAPTALRDPTEVLERHLADSLIALECVAAIRTASRIADLGAGAGAPGLPLAIALPEAEVALVESQARKCRFIERTIVSCRVGNARCVHIRAESWRSGLGCFDMVTARALASLSVVAEYAAPLLRVGGTLVAWRGRRDPQAELAGAAAASALGLEVAAPIPVTPYLGSEHRHLHLMKKICGTPARFPRRPGMAHKRPLGLS